MLGTTTAASNLNLQENILQFVCGIEQQIKQASGRDIDWAISCYTKAGEMLKAAQSAFITVDNLTQLVQVQIAPFIVEDITERIKQASGRDIDWTISCYDKAGKMLKSAQSSGITGINFEQLVQERITPLIVGDVVERVSQANGKNIDWTISCYEKAGIIFETAQSSGLAGNNLAQLIQKRITPIIVDDIKECIKQADGRDIDWTLSCYEKTKVLLEAAKNFDLTDSKFEQLIKETIAPLILQDIIVFMGENNNPLKLSKRYLKGKQILDIALRLGIIDREPIAKGLSSHFEKGLIDACVKAFESGKWEDLKLQKNAEESGLFLPGTINKVRSTIIALLETSIRISVEFGDRREAFDKLNEMKDIGIVNVEEYKRLSGKYALIESIMN
jgi:hypothetical protein